MLINTTRNVLIASILSAGLLVSGCGGGSSGSSGGAGSDTSPQIQSNTTVANGVTGPLDEVQNPVAENFFGQMESSSTGTPLATTFECGGQAIAIDLVDVLDSVALALVQTTETQDPASVFEGASANIQFSLEELTYDLMGALGAVTGADCSGASGNDGSNALAGTPLDPLGAALAPVLLQFPNAGGARDDSPAMNLNSLSQLANQLSLAFSSGLTQIPLELRQAPIFGGMLTTLNTGLSDLAATLTHFAAYNPDASAAALETTLNNLLVNVLTGVVPLNHVEAQAGQNGTLSGPIISGVNLVTSALGDNLLAAALPQVTAALGGELAALLSPIENILLPALLGPVTTALAGSSSDSFTLILGPLTDALTGGGSASDPTGTPIDALLGPLIDQTGSTDCPFIGTALAGGCTLFSVLTP